MFDAMQIYEAIETLIVIRGLSDRKAEQEAGVARGTLRNMINGSMPSVDKVAAFADYFGVSVDFLIGREKNIAPIEADRSDLANALKAMSKDEVKRLIDFAKFLLSERQAQEQSKD